MSYNQRQLYCLWLLGKNIVLTCYILRWRNAHSLPWKYKVQIRGLHTQGGGDLSCQPLLGGLPPG